MAVTDGSAIRIVPPKREWVRPLRGGAGSRPQPGKAVLECQAIALVLSVRSFRPRISERTRTVDLYRVNSQAI